MSETCPSCGAPVEDVSGRCSRCGGATTRRYIVEGGPASRGAVPPPPEILLPCPVPDARYIAGDVWTHGLLYLTDFGIYFLSEEDGPWTPERLLTTTPPDPSQPYGVGRASYFLPLNRIERFQHSRLTSFSIGTRDGKKPLRLTADGWRAIDSYAARVGIPSS